MADHCGRKVDVSNVMGNALKLSLSKLRRIFDPSEEQTIPFLLAYPAASRGVGGPALAGGFKRLAVTLTVVLLLTATPGVIMAAEKKVEGKQTKGSWITEAGFIIGYGDASLDEGVYRTLLMMGHFGQDITRFIPALRNYRGTLSFFLEPQFNYVIKPAGEVELGLGIGFQYAYPITERILPYLLVVSGPHYISVNSTTQANGFNFSSALGAGIYLSLTKHMALNVGYRHRHVSNAEIKKPNEGIDSEIGLVGLSFFF